ncbi:MAG: nicotinate phosphoribosyltransferase [Actinomycetota bacterium]|nr:nicotinate phosphoribosyltransferase [Actinomycetota bacterium]
MIPARGPAIGAAPWYGADTTGLLTDHYELTMVDAALRSGVADRRAVFEVFARRLPEGRRYGVVAGTARVLDAIRAFRFGEAELAWLAAQEVLSDDALAWLAGYRFGGHVWGYAEGEPYFPYSPILTVEAPFAEALVLETVVLSILNHDSAVAAAAARMVDAANGVPLIEGGGRRTHELAAPAAARAAWIAGFSATSNLEAGRRYAIPTVGTTAHAFQLVHLDDERAFAAQRDRFGPSGTYLVDTWDIPDGIRAAVAAAGPELGAVRIDSGDHRLESQRARRLLDELGAPDAGIVVSGDLDEHKIAALAGAPIDRMLVGTELVTGAGMPTAHLVYKLVAVAEGDGPEAPLVGVAKRSRRKETPPGPRVAHRTISPRGRAVAEVVRPSGGRPAPGDPAHPPGRPGGRALQRRFVDAGEVLGTDGLDAARAHHRAAMAELEDTDRDLRAGVPRLDATPSGSVADQG